MCYSKFEESNCIILGQRRFHNIFSKECWNWNGNKIYENVINIEVNNDEKTHGIQLIENNISTSSSDEIDISKNIPRTFATWK